MQMTLEWVDLCCTFPTPRGPKSVLSSVSGTAFPMQMTALMGPSGAGKSTLLNILTLRQSNAGKLTGSVTVNGTARDQSFLNISGYVPQDENFLPQMTVLEVLIFYARITLPLSMTKAERMERVEEALAVLGLQAQRNTLVGGVLPGGILLRGVSGGERKRLNIGTSIIARPSIVFLDEPTSALSTDARQPDGSHSALNKLCVILVSQGMVMYEGPTVEMIPWFTQSLEYQYNPEVNGVPSDWVLDLVSVGFSKPKAG
ncbi:MAG: hypothetical protein WDW38_007242 [Sanguina aurantia]